MAMNLSEALKILGLSNKYYAERPDSATLKQMRRKDFIKYHPDKGGDADKFIEVAMAWDRVIEYVVSEEFRKMNACEECEGRGFIEKKIPFGYTETKCKKCKGTGKKCRKD